MPTAGIEPVTYALPTIILRLFALVARWFHTFLKFKNRRYIVHIFKYSSIIYLWNINLIKPDIAKIILKYSILIIDVLLVNNINIFLKGADIRTTTAKYQHNRYINNTGIRASSLGSILSFFGIRKTVKQIKNYSPLEYWRL